VLQRKHTRVADLARGQRNMSAPSLMPGTAA
jgi:hypothetical protein